MEQPVMLTATRMDPAVAIPGISIRPRIESVHRAAVYVRLEGPRLVVIAIEDVGGLPGGVLVGAVTDFRTLDLARRPIAIDTGSARAWSPRLPAAARWEAGAVVANVQAARGARALAAKRAPAGGLGPLLAGEDATADLFAVAAARQVAELGRAIAWGGAADAAAAARRLLGLGVGLTPSGDDVLVGLLAGLEATAHPLRPSIAAVIADEAESRTTALSAAALIHAVRGEYAERLHDVLIAIAKPDPPALARAIARAMAYGATSGADTLVGVFLGLEPGASRARASAA